VVFRRHGVLGGNYFYDLYQIRVSTSGTYSLTTMSVMDTYGYLYLGTFFPSSPRSVLIAIDDDSGGDGQFAFTLYLDVAYTYYAVVTTSIENIAGEYKLIVSGGANVELTPSPGESDIFLVGVF
jgi:hypothetical protein